MTPISPFDSNFFKITNYLKLIKRNLEIKNLRYLKLLENNVGNKIITFIKNL